MGHIYCPMFFNTFVNNIFDALAPIECLNCGQGNNWCCQICQEKFINTQPPIIIDNYCKEISKIVCSFNYQNKVVQELIHACKYESIQDSVNALALHLSEGLKNQIKLQNNHYYILVPVPLHPNRQRERGFNQSQIIAGIVSKALNIPTLSSTRSINTPHQVGLNAEQRQNNMKGVFEFNGVAVETLRCNASTAIIIDDVITTGATIKSLAGTLSPYFTTIWAAALAKE